MEFCDECNNRMKIHDDNGSIIYKCVYCTNTKKFDRSKPITIYNTTQDVPYKIKKLLDQLAFQPWSKKVNVQCPNCGIKQVSMYRLEHSEKIFYKCYCGALFHPV